MVAKVDIVIEHNPVVEDMMVFVLVEGDMMVAVVGVDMMVVEDHNVEDMIVVVEDHNAEDMMVVVVEEDKMVVVEDHNVEDMLAVEKDIEEDMRVVEEVGFLEDSYLGKVHED